MRKEQRKQYGFLLSLSLLIGLVGCGKTQAQIIGEETQTTSLENTEEIIESTKMTDTANDIDNENITWNVEFTARDLEVGYEENDSTIITFEEKGIQAEGKGMSIEDTTITIEKEGIYILTGSCSNGQVVINASDTDKIQLIFKNLELHYENQSPIYIKNADKVFITLEEGSSNYLSDGTEYELTDEENNLDGVIFSKADLAINGGGKLEITANYKHGIVSKDDLVITGGDISITSVHGGLYGKDCVKIKDGNFLLNTGTNAIKSDNEEDTQQGYVYICGGSFIIDTKTDGIKAQNMIWIMEGEFNITAVEDTIHSNGDIIIEGGTISLNAKDDAIHGDGTITIKEGRIDILESYEGIEGADIIIEGGIISVVSSDDGVNAAGGSDGEETNTNKSPDSFRSKNSNNFIRITGGTIEINAGGDGIDSNGSFYMDGGTVYINGPSDHANGALDYDKEAIITGGTILAIGSSGVPQNFSNSSAQPAFLYVWTQIQKQGSTIILKDSNGTELLCYTPIKDYQSVVISTEDLIQGNTYYLVSGTEEAIEITLNSIITNIGTNGFGIPQGGGMEKPENRPNREIPPEGMENREMGTLPERIWEEDGKKETETSS